MSTKIESLRTVVGRKAENPQEIARKKFLLNIKNAFAINNIYYPGSSNDYESLESPFSREQIIYVDKIPKNLKSQGYVHVYEGLVSGEFVELEESEEDKKLHRNLIVANAKMPPFQKGIFDAVFMQDMDATDEDFAGVMFTLKMGGILIFSNIDCGEGIQLYHLKKHRELAELHLRYRTEHYTAFQKIDPLGVSKE